MNMLTVLDGSKTAIAGSNSARWMQVDCNRIIHAPPPGIDRRLEMGQYSFQVHYQVRKIFPCFRISHGFLGQNKPREWTRIFQSV
jgi:hypothetical protein